MDILAVEWRNERTVQPVECLVGQVVGLVFLLADPLKVIANVREILRQSAKMLGRRDHVRGKALEQIEKDFVLRQQVQHWLAPH